MKNLTDKDKTYYAEHSDEFIKMLLKDAKKKFVSLFAASVAMVVASFAFLLFQTAYKNTADIIYVFMAYLGYYLMQSAVTMKTKPPTVYDAKSIFASSKVLVKLIFGLFLFFTGTQWHLSEALNADTVTLYRLYFPAIAFVLLAISGLLKLSVHKHLSKYWILRNMLKRNVKIEFYDEVK